jgi:protein gp37
MFAEKSRYGQNPNIVVRSATSTFNAPLKWAKNRAKYGHINRVFVDSWSDFFIEEADPWRLEAWEIMRSTPELTYQLCTKRPERIRECLPPDWHDGLPNVWLGVSTENQEMANLRIPILNQIPAIIHWASAEPLLGPIDFREAHRSISRFPRLDWIVTGGESGSNARPMLSSWASSIRDQCRAAGVAFFHKQNGEWVDFGNVEMSKLPEAPLAYIKSDGTPWPESAPLPSDEDADVNTCKRVGRNRAGHLLYGHEYHKFPDVR